MKIILNNLPEIIDRDTLTVRELLNIKKFTFKMLVVRVNGKPIKQQDYDTTYINDGDKVDVIHLISGG
ncbi:MAG: sulfur carrier protein ThiS [Bacteroidales bacterium]|nr:sulfur carrier protein ThiS [Bacteroidales bacterium]